MALLFDPLTATAHELQAGLKEGKFNSVYLVNAYLSQIQKYNGYLHAVLSVAPRLSLFEQAKALDAERETGKTRGPLHGIPILLKVIITTSSLIYKYRCRSQTGNPILLNLDTSI